ncbi:hypothetical protein A2U01_0111603, partial [Trifolium medium]|nr:hypothetical protein [Trifolium medium]
VVVLVVVVVQVGFVVLVVFQKMIFSHERKFVQQLGLDLDVVLGN